MFKVSVVVPHYGDPRPTLRLLGQLRSSSSILEVIVVDDCSPTRFPDDAPARVIHRPVNGGFGAAVNTGAATATGELLLILNSDLRIDPGFVDGLVAAADPWMPCAAAPDIVGTDGAADPTGRHFPAIGHQALEWLTPLARWRDRRLLHEAVGHDTRAVPGQVTTVDWLVGAALLLPLADFRAVGGFDEQFHMNSEEVDLQRRLRTRGLPSLYVGTVNAIHEGGASSDPALRRRWLVESRDAYAAKWGGRGRLRMSLTAATGANLVWNAGRSAAGRDVHPLATARHELDLIWRRR